MVELKSAHHKWADDLHPKVDCDSQSVVNLFQSKSLGSVIVAINRQKTQQAASPHSSVELSFS